MGTDKEHSIKKITIKRAGKSDKQPEVVQTGFATINEDTVPEKITMASASTNTVVDAIDYMNKNIKKRIPEPALKSLTKEMVKIKKEKNNNKNSEFSKFSFKDNGVDVVPAIKIDAIDTSKFKDNKDFEKAVDFVDANENGYAFACPNSLKGGKFKSIRNYNIGQSNYSTHKIQPWDIWEDYNLDPWDADIVKRVLRRTGATSRADDYRKIIHVCLKQLERLGENY